MGIGRGFGKSRATDAALAAVSSPLLDFPISQARGVVFTISGSSDMSLQEVNCVARVISDIVSDDANIIFGASVDDSFGDEIVVTVVATNFAATSDDNMGNPTMPLQQPVEPRTPPLEARPRRFWNRF